MNLFLKLSILLKYYGLEFIIKQRSPNIRLKDRKTPGCGDYHNNLHCEESFIAVKESKYFSFYNRCDIQKEKQTEEEEEIEKNMKRGKLLNTDNNTSSIIGIII